MNADNMYTKEPPLIWPVRISYLVQLLSDPVTVRAADEPPAIARALWDTAVRREASPNQGKQYLHLS